MGPIFDFDFDFDFIFLPHCKDLHTSIFSPCLQPFAKNPNQKVLLYLPYTCKETTNKPQAAFTLGHTFRKVKVLKFHMFLVNGSGILTDSKSQHAPATSIIYDLGNL